MRLEIIGIGIRVDDFNAKSFTDETFFRRDIHVIYDGLHPVGQNLRIDRMRVIVSGDIPRIDGTVHIRNLPFERNM